MIVFKHDEGLIVAFAHERQKPGYRRSSWLERRVSHRSPPARLLRLEPERRSCPGNDQPNKPLSGHVSSCTELRFYANRVLDFRLGERSIRSTPGNRGVACGSAAPGWAASRVTNR